MSYLGTVVQAKSPFFEVLIQKRKSAGLGPCGSEMDDGMKMFLKKGKWSYLLFFSVSPNSLFCDAITRSMSSNALYGGGEERRSGGVEDERRDGESDVEPGLTQDRTEDL